MELSLLLGLSFFMACWFIHLVIWRIHRPKAYPIWLPIIFLLIPLSAAVVYGMLPVPEPQAKPMELVAGGLLHIVLSCSYICGYAGIIEYSPSAEILLVVRKHMPGGISEEALTVESLTEYSLTGKRIDHLISTGVVRLEGERYALTPMGNFIACMFKNYRLFLGLTSIGEG